MRAAWRAADIRVAEERLLSTLPELTLMQRAAAGLARRCASLLSHRGGDANGTGTNGSGAPLT
jgi:NAD(P)H-hydrate repair Nnr-like enzyme with NAD(P)H-hydrate epimerase domain